MVKLEKTNSMQSETMKILAEKLSKKSETAPAVKAQQTSELIGKHGVGGEVFEYDVNELNAQTKTEAKQEEKKYTIADVKLTNPKTPEKVEPKVAVKEPKDWEKISNAKKLNSEFDTKDMFSGHRISNAGTQRISDLGGPNSKSKIHNSIFDSNVLANMKEIGSGKKLAEDRKAKEAKTAEDKKTWEKDAAQGAVPEMSPITRSGQGTSSAAANWSSAAGLGKHQLSIFDTEKLGKTDKGNDEVIAEQNTNRQKAITREAKKEEIVTQKANSTAKAQSKLLDALLGK